MDNNFYASERNKKNRREKEKNKNTGVLIVQFLASVTVTVLLFCMCSSESEFSNDLKNWLKDRGKTDIAVYSIFDSIKDVVKETFSPSVTVNYSGNDETLPSQNVTSEGIKNLYFEL